MGQSTNAILCYGFSLTEDDSEQLPWLLDESGDQMDFSDFLAKKADLNMPPVPWVQDGNNDPWYDYWRMKREIEDKVGVTLVMHCSDEYPMYILAIKDSVHVAIRGTPELLGQSIPLARVQGWEKLLSDFCGDAGIPFVQPQWMLCSMWS